MHHTTVQQNTCNQYPMQMSHFDESHDETEADEQTRIPGTLQSGS